MRQPIDVIETFRPVHGLMCWGCKRGHGSFITIEFGEPHLRIREPLARLEGQQTQIRKRLYRRRVTIAGDWHLWIESASWRLEVDERTVESSKFDSKVLDGCLDVLSGQILDDVKFDQSSLESQWLFDGGGRLFARPDPGVNDDIWSLFGIDGSVVTFRADGSLSLESAGEQA